MVKKGKGKIAGAKSLKKEVKKIKAENGHKNKKDFRVLCALTCAFLILLAVVGYYKFYAGTASVGDKVSVKYVGTLANGTVFDTNIKEEAQKAGLYNSKRGYTDLKFRIGEGQMIAGFDEAVRGMKIGETKTVTIPSSKAYGDFKDNETLILPMRKELALYDKITRDIIIHPQDLVDTFNVSTLIKVNGTLPATAKYKWPILVMKIGDRDLTGRLLVNIGDYYEEGSFNYTITSVSGSEMVVKRRPLNPILPSKFGQLMLFEEKGKIVSLYNVTVGEKANIDGKSYTIIAADGENMTLDGNHPLAGKTLTFRITLVNIE